MYLMSLKKEDHKVDPIWYQMYLSIGFMEVEQNSYESDLFGACVIREVSGSLLDDYCGYPKPLDSTGRAIVGLNVNDVECRDTNSIYCGAIYMYYAINIANNTIV